MPATYEPIASTTLGTAATTVTLSAIPQTFTDLILVTRYRSTGGGSELYMWPNGDSASNETKFSRTFLYGNGSSAASGRQNPGNNGGYAGSIGWATNAGTNTSIVQMMSYTNPNVFKTSLVNLDIVQSAGFVSRQVNLYMSTSAVSSLLFGLYPGQSFEVGTTFSLYGIKAA